MPRLPIYAKKYAMSDFGKYLKFCRDLNGVNQADLAEKLGVTQQTVSQIEREPGKITLDRMYEINKAMPLDIIQLLKVHGFTVPQIRDYFRDYFKDS